MTPVKYDPLDVECPACGVPPKASCFDRRVPSRLVPKSHYLRRNKAYRRACQAARDGRYEPTPQELEDYLARLAVEREHAKARLDGAAGAGRDRRFREWMRPPLERAGIGIDAAEVLTPAAYALRCGGGWRL